MPATDGPVFLVVDDDPMVRRIVARGLNQLNPSAVLEEEDGIAARDVLQARHVDVVITDMVMPNMGGLELMKWAQRHRPEPLWVVLSGVETFDAAVEALQLGAFDYLAKPPEVPRVRVAVRNALDQIELIRERKRLYAELEDSNVQLGEKVGQLQQVCRVLEDQAILIQADLDRAEVIQRALLPQEPPTMPGWCMETLYRPGSSVGGDFYDAVVMDDRYLGVVIADAAGHGVAAAMLSVLFKLRLKQRDADNTVLNPQQVLQRLNGRLYDMLTAPGAFITASYVLLDLDNGEGFYASAGHPPCIITGSEKRSQLLGRTGPALGLEPEANYTEHTFVLDPGDRLLLYTDGVLEGGPKSPSTATLTKTVLSDGDRETLLESLFQAAIHGVSGDRDDITLLLLQRSQGNSHFDDALADKSAPAPAEAILEPAQDTPRLLQGKTANCGFIRIVGSVTWLCGQALLECSRALLAQVDHLIVDLQDCRHLDSTCLGTLHEIVTARPDAVTLQGVDKAVLGLFEELSMSTVLKHVRADHLELPGEMCIVHTASLTPHQQGARILSAHETLSSLSEGNRDQFRAVVDSLRADLSPADQI